MWIKTLSNWPMLLMMSHCIAWNIQINCSSEELAYTSSSLYYLTDFFFWHLVASVLSSLWFDLMLCERFMYQSNSTSPAWSSFSARRKVGMVTFTKVGVISDNKSIICQGWTHPQTACYFSFWSWQWTYNIHSPAKWQLKAALTKVLSLFWY